MEDKFKCMFCPKEFPSRMMLQGHQDKEHDIILLPVMKEELVKLVRYIQLSDVIGNASDIRKGQLISPALFDRMRKLLLKIR